MLNGVIEGTWEEIIQHSSELTGRRVRVTLLDEAQKPDAPNQTMLDVLRMIEDDIPQRTMTTGEDTEGLLRAARSGAVNQETVTPNYAMLSLMQDLQNSPRRMTSGEDTEELLRAARSGAMYGDERAD